MIGKYNVTAIGGQTHNMQLLYCEPVGHYFTDYIEWILNVYLKLLMLSYRNVSQNEGYNCKFLNCGSLTQPHA